MRRFFILLLLVFSSSFVYANQTYYFYPNGLPGDSRPISNSSSSVCSSVASALSGGSLTYTFQGASGTACNVRINNGYSQWDDVIYLEQLICADNVKPEWNSVASGYRCMSTCPANQVVNPNTQQCQSPCPSEVASEI